MNYTATRKIFEKNSCETQNVGKICKNCLKILHFSNLRLFFFLLCCPKKNYAKAKIILSPPFFSQLFCVDIPSFWSLRKMLKFWSTFLES